DVRTGLLTASNPGRFQVLPGRPAVILDVAHNPAAAAALARNLSRMPKPARTFAVFAMLRDQDVDGVIACMKDVIDEWLVAGLEGERGSAALDMREALARAGIVEHVSVHESVAAAHAFACESAGVNDRIAVFGSFYTVAAVLAQESGAD